MILLTLRVLPFFALLNVLGSVTLALADESFSNSGSLEASQCGFPGLPAHAIIFPGDQSQFSPGEIAQYECEEGRVMFGEGTRVCRQNGSWSGEPVICSKNEFRKDLVASWHFPFQLFNSFQSISLSLLPFLPENSKLISSQMI